MKSSDIVVRASWIGERARGRWDAIDVIGSAWPDGDEPGGVGSSLWWKAERSSSSALDDPELGPLALVGLGGGVVEERRDVQMWLVLVSP